MSTTLNQDIKAADLPSYAEMQALMAACGKEAGNPHNLLDRMPPGILAEVHPALIKYDGIYGSCTETVIDYLKIDAANIAKPVPLAFKAAANPSPVDEISLAATFRPDPDLPRIG